jgi:hypothetical protein
MTTRYPVSARSLAVLVCVLFAIAIAKDIARGSVNAPTIIVAVVVLGLSASVLAYKAEVDANLIHIRYFPFYRKHTSFTDIRHVVNGTTLVLVTSTSTIPLWGMSLEARKRLLEMLPGHIEVVRRDATSRTYARCVLRKHLRRTALAGAGLVATVTAVVPFLGGYPLHEYWDTVGRYVLIVCMASLLLFGAQAGFTLLLWSNKRIIEKLERDDRDAG